MKHTIKFIDKTKQVVQHSDKMDNKCSPSRPQEHVKTSHQAMKSSRYSLLSMNFNTLKGHTVPIMQMFPLLHINL